MKFRKHFDYDVTAASDEATIKDNGESLTVQSQTEDTDINVMMSRFGVTGKMPVDPRVPSYGDFTGISDYRSALDAIRDADDAFMEWTPDVRNRFDNDPQKALEFFADEKNREEAIRMGFIPKPPPKAAENLAPVAPAPVVP